MRTRRLSASWQRRSTNPNREWARHNRMHNHIRQHGLGGAALPEGCGSRGTNRERLHTLVSLAFAAAAHSSSVWLLTHCYSSEAGILLCDPGHSGCEGGKHFSSHLINNHQTLSRRIHDGNMIASFSAQSFFPVLVMLMCWSAAHCGPCRQTSACHSGKAAHSLPGKAAPHTLVHSHSVGSGPRPAIFLEWLPSFRTPRFCFDHWSSMSAC